MPTSASIPRRVNSRRALGGLDINNSSQSQGAPRRNENTGKIEEKGVGAEGLKTPNQRKRHEKGTRTEAEVARRREGKRKKIEKEQQPGERMEEGQEKRWKIGSEKKWESGMEKESISRTVETQGEREDICRTPTIDLHEVWSMDEDGDLADIRKVAALTARFLKLLREARDKFKDLMRIIWSQESSVRAGRG
ncbi:hypothetical protein MMC29_005538 [Sticta canariensis]|nr:hypothetical protein [Sticta canariensis]